MRVVTRNKWWGSLKYRIRDFTIKYNRQSNLDKTKKAKSLEDRLSQVMERRDSLAIDLVGRTLSERLASECYKGFVERG